MTKQKSSWGGKRSGSGQPKKSPTKTIAFRVPLELVDEIKLMVKNKVEAFRLQGNGEKKENKNI